MIPDYQSNENLVQYLVLVLNNSCSTKMSLLMMIIISIILIFIFCIVFIIGSIREGSTISSSIVIRSISVMSSIV